MSNMKCPFCQQELDTGNYYVHCHNPHCDITEEMEGTEEMWEALIRTRKALDILLLTINRLEKQNYKDCAWHLRLAIAKIKATDIANKALEQITALEQKDK